MNEKTRAALGEISTATISMQLLKRGLRSVYMQGVKPLTEDGGRLVGEAYTLRFIPGREDLSTPEVLKNPNLSQRRAIESCTPGAVLVIDGLGMGHVGTLGDILAERLKQRGVAGVVTDGAVRDGESVRAVGLPIFCAGCAAPASISGLSDGDLQVPIGCGGVAVLPGDVIVADGDGALVIPAAIADEVASAGLEQERQERFIQMQVRNGAAVPGTYPPSDENNAKYRQWVEDGEKPF